MTKRYVRERPPARVRPAGRPATPAPDGRPPHTARTADGRALTFDARVRTRTLFLARV